MLHDPACALPIRLNLPYAGWAATASSRPLSTEAGYYDQSHMIHELPAITGRAPLEVHAERQAENELGTA